MFRLALFTTLLALIVGCGSPSNNGAVPQRMIAPGELPPASVEPVVKQQVVVMDFWASWCAPCRRFAPTFDAWSKKYSNDNVKFVKVDADKQRDLVTKYQVHALPTVVIEVNGKVVAKFEGAPTEGQLVAHLPK
jgi:thioredoxin